MKVACFHTNGDQRRFRRLPTRINLDKGGINLDSVLCLIYANEDDLNVDREEVREVRPIGWDKAKKKASSSSIPSES
ncbi:hypothetical protein Tco_0489312 [Tanacetum coccineum]